jgi:hypothetical protein
VLKPACGLFESYGIHLGNRNTKNDLVYIYYNTTAMIPSTRSKRATWVANYLVNRMRCMKWYLREETSNLIPHSEYRHGGIELLETPWPITPLSHRSSGSQKAKRRIETRVLLSSRTWVADSLRAKSQATQTRTGPLKIMQ